MTWPQVDGAWRCRERDRRPHADARGPRTRSGRRRGAPRSATTAQNLIARGFDPVELRLPGRLRATRLCEAVVRDCGYTVARRVGGIVSPNWCPTCGSPRAETLPPENPLLVRTPAFGSGEITLGAVQNVILQAEASGGGWVPHRVPRRVRDGTATRAGCGRARSTALMDWLAPAPHSARWFARCVRRWGRTPRRTPSRPDTSISQRAERDGRARLRLRSRSPRRRRRSFECQLDAGAWARVHARPGRTRAWAQGAHTFSVRAIDAAGNVDATPASRTWTVDTGAPDTSITSGPSGTVASASASFAFTSTESGPVRVQARRGRVGRVHVAEGVLGLAQGAHTFSVRAKDGGGQRGCLAGHARRGRLTRSPPDTSISTAGPTWERPRRASASFDVLLDARGGSFECRLDAGAWGACSSPEPYSSLAKGSHTLLGDARRTRAGNVDATPATRTMDGGHGSSTTPSRADAARARRSARSRRDSGRRSVQEDRSARALPAVARRPARQWLAGDRGPRGDASQPTDTGDDARGARRGRGDDTARPGPRQGR